MENTLHFKIPLQAELSFEALGELIKSLPKEMKTLLFEMLKNEIMEEKVVREDTNNGSEYLNLNFRN